ncbi:MAG: helix-turn-helix transcriptional regulator [Beijerinckiaceae bacterium]|nr:helix-turn-helix transcriptional regulator [Beijerinckiaceae bacterium]
MANAQIIKTPGDGELVVLSRSEYDALVAAASEAEEEAADIAIFDRRKAGLAAGRDAMLPAEVCAAMLRGMSLLKALRRWRNMSQLDVARGAAVAQGYLSGLESGRRRGSEETLKAIAKVLGIDPAWILQKDTRAK